MNGNKQDKPFEICVMFPYLFMFLVFLFHAVPLVALLGKVAQSVKKLGADQKVLHSNLTKCLAGLRGNNLITRLLVILKSILGSKHSG